MGFYEELIPSGKKCKPSCPYYYTVGTHKCCEVYGTIKGTKKCGVNMEELVNLKIRKVVKKQENIIVAKIGRNELCSCGSGKKYKKCCGKGGKQ